MRYFALVTLSLFASFIALPALAADPNGYVAIYECRAGGSKCDLDIPTLVSAPCDVTVSTSDTDWSKITNNTNARVFCIAAGDHRAKGALALTASGTASARKILRYVSPSDNDDDPWRQSNGAIIRKLDFNAASYWLVQRLTVDGDGASQDGVFFRSGSNNNVLNRMLVQNHRGYQVIADWNGPTDGNVLQNSVIRKGVPQAQFESDCIDAQKGTHMRIVNNEAYDCHKIFSIGSGVVDTRGMVVENNDFYVSAEYYTDCAGNYNGTGPCSASEGLMSIKAGGIAGDPAIYTHNRLWGGRNGDGVLLGGDNVGHTWGISISASAADNPGLKADYVLFQNNVVMNVQSGVGGFWGPDQHISVIGNIIYDIHAFQPGWQTIALQINSKQYSQFFLNTIINADQWMDMGGSDAAGGPSMNDDIKCNVIMNGGSSTISPGSGVDFSNNAFFNTKPYPGTSTDNMIFASVADARTEEMCFFRKLRTNPERVCIPNAKPTTASPHYRACDVSLLSRTGIGISNEPLF